MKKLNLSLSLESEINDDPILIHADEENPLTWTKFLWTMHNREKHLRIVNIDLNFGGAKNESDDSKIQTLC